MKLVSEHKQLNHDGPIRKFYLIKQFGQKLRDAGYAPHTMSCAQIEALIIELNLAGAVAGLE